MEKFPFTRWQGEDVGKQPSSRVLPHQNVYRVPVTVFEGLETGVGVEGKGAAPVPAFFPEVVDGLVMDQPVEKGGKFRLTAEPGQVSHQGHQDFLLNFLAGLEVGSEVDVEKPSD